MVKVFIEDGWLKGRRVVDPIVLPGAATTGAARAAMPDEKTVATIARVSAVDKAVRPVAEAMDRIGPIDAIRTHVEALDRVAIAPFASIAEEQRASPADDLRALTGEELAELERVGLGLAPDK
jgi:hypothetical protein